MEVRKCILGIDLGTSSVKILKKYEDGSVVKLKNTYEKPLPLGWWQSILALLEQIEWQEVIAIGLSSQVGTYLVNEEEVIGWNQPVGKEELQWWKENYTREQFVQEISMPHPDIISYPLPRLKYIKDHVDNVKTICQPKEYILKQLTGEWMTDSYSWRGLANLEKKDYSGFFLRELGIEKSVLPIIQSHDSLAGYTKEISLETNTLPQGIPVYIGMNDYYAGLLGMGVKEAGQMFDLTGTSEHVGVIQEAISPDTTLVSGPYLKDVVHYGVTASSGPSIKYGLRMTTLGQLDLNKMVLSKPPIFLPYLKGERAPIWNPDARGVLFGLEEKTDLEQIQYAIMEGVVFSLYHIYETMGKPSVNNIIISGGAAEIAYLNELKAEVFGSPVQVVTESDVSALGACMVAAVGAGLYENYEQIQREWIHVEQTIEPKGGYEGWFQKRFEIYKNLYTSVNHLYGQWKEL